MKKFACLLLALILLLPVAAFTEAAPSKGLHLLWDIPFGISIDEFTSLVKEKTGFEMESTPDKDDGVRRTASLSLGPSYMKIFGYEASSISASFYKSEYRTNAAGKGESFYPMPQEESLNYISILWIIGNNATSEYAADAFANILFDLEKKYGEAEFLDFTIYTPSFERFQCEIEKRDGYINTEDIVKFQYDHFYRLV